MFEWSDTDLIMRDTAREFIDKEIRPHLDGSVAAILVRARRDRGPLRDPAHHRRSAVDRARRVSHQPQGRAHLHGPAEGGGEPGDARLGDGRVARFRVAAR